MAIEQFRTTVSAVFWTMTPGDSDEIVAAITAALPEDDRNQTLATVEYRAEGPPVQPAPDGPPVGPVEGT